jgi:hypothetical protein
MTSETVGVKLGSVWFTNNDPNEDPYEIVIQGAVEADSAVVSSQPVMNVYCSSNNKNVPDGGTVYFTNTANTLYFSIFNRGQSDLNIGNFSLPNNSGYSVIGPSSYTVKPGQSVSFTIKMNPAIAKSTPIRLQIADNDPNQNPFDILLARK